MSDEAPEPASVESPLSLGQVFDAITPPGTNGAELLAALKGARRPTIPMRQEILPDQGNAGCYWPIEDAREPASAPPGRASASLPADPFRPGAVPAASLAEFREDLVGAGIPVESADRIIGTMLAEAYGGGKPC